MGEEQKQPGLDEAFIRMHRVISRGLTVCQKRGAEYVQGGFPNERLQHGYLDFTHCLVTVLTAHHMVEDELAFPFLRERRVQAPYGRLSANHLRIKQLLAKVNENLPAAEGNDPADGLKGLLAALETIWEIWQPHIESEENCFTGEAVASLVSPSDQADLFAAMGRHASSNSNPPELVLPFVLYNLSGAERQGMAMTLPRPVLDMVEKDWKTRWEMMKPFLLQ